MNPKTYSGRKTFKRSSASKRLCVASTSDSRLQSTRRASATNHSTFELNSNVGWHSDHVSQSYPPYISGKQINVYEYRRLLFVCDRRGQVVFGGPGATEEKLREFEATQRLKIGLAWGYQDQWDCRFIIYKNAGSWDTRRHNRSDF